MAKKLKVYNGASWEDVTFAITPPNTDVTNSFTTNQVIDASTSVAALRITQRGTGEALRVEDETNPDSSPFVIDASGAVAIGSGTPIGKLYVASQSASATVVSARIGTSPGGAFLTRGANGTLTTPTISVNGDGAGSYVFQAYDGTAYVATASMTSSVDGTPGLNDMPGRLMFSTTADGGQNVTERMRIDSTGRVGIGTTTPSAILTTNASFQIGQSGTATNNWHLTSEAGDGKLRFWNGNYGSGTERIVFDSSGSIGIGINAPSSKLHLYNTLATSVGSKSSVFESQVDNGNQDFLKLYQERTLAISSWGGSDWVLRRHVDASPMGGFRWTAGDWNVTALYGTPATPSVRTTHISTSAPSGGIDGDIWAVYTA
jgi:hypothetical protein